MNNLSKIIILLAIVTCCCLTFAHSLKCYSCISTVDCKKPKLLECNSVLANQTRSYLNMYYTGVPNNTANGFQCVSDWLKTSSLELAHRGCIYNNYQSCGYTVHPIYAQSHKRSCKQCNQDKCNPADRASGSLIAVLIAVSATVLNKYF